MPSPGHSLRPSHRELRVESVPLGGLRLGPSASGDPEVLGLPLQLAVGGFHFHRHTSPMFSQENFPRLWQNEKNKDKPVSFSCKLIFSPIGFVLFFFLKNCLLLGVFGLPSFLA